MIATLEIDDQLFAQVEAAAKARGVGLRDFVAGALRHAVTTSSVAAPTRFAQRVHDFGSYIENPWAVMADLESERYARLSNNKK